MNKSFPLPVTDSSIDCFHSFLKLYYRIIDVYVRANRVPSRSVAEWWSSMIVNLVALHKLSSLVILMNCFDGSRV